MITISTIPVHADDVQTLVSAAVNAYEVGRLRHESVLQWIIAELSLAYPAAKSPFAQRLLLRIAHRRFDAYLWNIHGLRDPRRWP